LRPAREQDCRLIVDSISAHVVTLTAHGDIEFVNQQWLDYLGKALDEFAKLDQLQRLFIPTTFLAWCPRGIARSETGQAI